MEGRGPVTHSDTSRRAFVYCPRLLGNLSYQLDFKHGRLTKADAQPLISAPRGLHIAALTLSSLETTTNMKAEARGHEGPSPVA